MKRSYAFVLALLVIVTVLLARITPELRRGDSPRAGRQVKAVSYALEQYLGAHRGFMPALNHSVELEAALLPYLGEPGKTPSFAGEALSLPLLARPETGQRYVFNLSLVGKSLRDLPHPEQIISFYESEPNYGGRLVAYLDGHHIWINEPDWPRMRQSGRLP